MEEGFEEGIEATIPSTSTMGDSSVDTVTADGGSETSETSETPRRMKWCTHILLAFIATGLFAAMMTVVVAIGRSFGWNADASQASTVASENVHAGVLEADSSTSIDSDSILKVAGTAARSKASKAAKSSKTECPEPKPTTSPTKNPVTECPEPKFSEALLELVIEFSKVVFSEVGPGACLDSDGNLYDGIAYFPPSEATAESCLTAFGLLFSGKPGFVGMEIGTPPTPTCYFLFEDGALSCEDNPFPAFGSDCLTSFSGEGEIDAADDSLPGSSGFTCFKINGYIPFGTVQPSTPIMDD